LDFGTDLLQIPASVDPTRELFERAELLEELGFSFGTLGHHRFTEEVPSSTFTVLAAIAARTSTLRLAPAVLVLPCYHPLDIAEQVATVDQISGGRVFLNAGVGYRPAEFAPVQIDFHRRGERATECLEILKQVWTHTNVSFHGRHFEFDDVTVYPRPVQQPRPPIWMGAMLAPAVERAGRHADCWYGGMQDMLTDLLPLLERYRRAGEASNNPTSVCLKRSLGIAKDVETLEESWLPGFLDYRRYALTANAPFTSAEPEFDAKVLSGAPLTVAEVARDRAIAGTPDDCIRQIQRCVEVTGCDSMALNLNGQAKDPDELVSQLRLFASEVMPAFRP
jgi:probable F420-dependent oxidoreductase